MDILLYIVQTLITNKNGILIPKKVWEFLFCWNQTYNQTDLISKIKTLFFLYYYFLPLSLNTNVGLGPSGLAQYYFFCMILPLSDSSLADSSISWFFHKLILPLANCSKVDLLLNVRPGPLGLTHYHFSYNDSSDAKIHASQRGSFDF